METYDTYKYQVISDKKMSDKKIPDKKLSDKKMSDRKTTDILCLICYKLISNIICTDNIRNGMICEKCNNKYSRNKQIYFILINQLSDIIKF
jgi:hypothetical protein